MTQAHNQLKSVSVRQVMQCVRIQMPHESYSMIPRDVNVTPPLYMLPQAVLAHLLATVE